MPSASCIIKLIKCFSEAGLMAFRKIMILPIKIWKCPNLTYISLSKKYSKTNIRIKMLNVCRLLNVQLSDTWFLLENGCVNVP